MENVEVAIVTLGKLSKMGFEISLDDFGTGYSSLSYLRRFHVNLLKIDQSFVANLSDSIDDTLLVSGIISLAHSLKMKVIAEGVETKEQFETLLSLGCDYIQGYYF